MKESRIIATYKINYPDQGECEIHIYTDNVNLYRTIKNYAEANINKHAEIGRASKKDDEE